MYRDSHTRVMLGSLKKGECWSLPTLSRPQRGTLVGYGAGEPLPCYLLGSAWAAGEGAVDRRAYVGVATGVNKLS